LEWAFTEAFNRVLTDKDRYIADYDTIVRTLTDTAALDSEAAKLNEEIVEVYELLRRAMEENARIALDQDEYARRSRKLEARYAEAKKRLAAIADEKQQRTARREKLNRFLADIRRQDGLVAEFDESLWRATVESVTVHSEKDVAFTFRDGTEIHVDVRGK
ncbi:MAG: recombinase family protein, partial [Clostridiales Family XIII bacterium]|nr:recombinase family protein [Clostridiales Family XIII bacterium]